MAVHVGISSDIKAVVWFLSHRHGRCQGCKESADKCPQECGQHHSTALTTSKVSQQSSVNLDVLLQIGKKKYHKKQCLHEIA